MNPINSNGGEDLITAAVDWKDVWRRVERPRGSSLTRLPCRTPELCRTGDLCDHCRANEQNAEQVEEDKRALWFAKQRLFPLMEMVRRLVTVYGPELAETVRPVVYGILGAWLETVKPELGKMLETEVARKTPAAAAQAAAAIVAPDEVGRALRQRLTEALLPEIEDYLIDVALGCLDARPEAAPFADSPPENEEADVAPSEGERT